MSPALSYREYAPHPRLARYVECYWSSIGSIDPVAPLSRRVLPDGCMDVIVGLSPGASTSGDSAFVVGTMTRPLNVTHSGPVHFLAVRFNPGGAQPFLAIPAGKLTDLVVPLDDVWGAFAARSLREQVVHAPSDEARVRVFDRVLLDRLAHHPGIDEAVIAVSELVSARHGAISVSEMADTVRVGRRQLERRFLASVGITPKVACRIARFRWTIGLLHRDPTTPLAEVTFAAGYADQSHLTREFRLLGGLTPGAYRRERTPA